VLPRDRQSKDEGTFVTLISGDGERVVERDPEFEGRVQARHACAGRLVAIGIALQRWERDGDLLEERVSHLETAETKSR